MTRPYIVGLGGTTRAGSSTQMALSLVLEAARQQGADTLLLSGSDLDLPAYTPGAEMLAARAQRILVEIRRADGVILATPGYHGGISGLVKNALDYTEELKGDQRPYLEGRAVGCIVTAAGTQGAMTTLIALRSVVHALRGWPTPLGVAIVTSSPVFDAAGNCLSSGLETQLKLVAQQVFDFAVSQMKSVSSDRSACRIDDALEQIA
jgi:FMN reductase